MHALFNVFVPVTRFLLHPQYKDVTINQIVLTVITDNR